MPFIENSSAFYICTYRLALHIQMAFLFLHYSSGILTISHLTINISKGFNLLRGDLLKCVGSGSASVRVQPRSAGPTRLVLWFGFLVELFYKPLRYRYAL